MELGCGASFKCILRKINVFSYLNTPNLRSPADVVAPPCRGRVTVYLRLGVLVGRLHPKIL